MRVRACAEIATRTGDEQSAAPGMQPGQSSDGMRRRGQVATPSGVARFGLEGVRDSGYVSKHGVLPYGPRGDGYADTVVVPTGCLVLSPRDNGSTVIPVKVPQRPGYPPGNANL